MAHHTIKPTEDTVHTFFSPELEPILTIASGDTICFETLEVGGRLEPPTTPSPKRIIPSREGPSGHALCGPIAIKGAKPGMTLAVEIGALRPGAWGWTGARGKLTRGQQTTHIWTLSADRKQGRNQFGHSVAMRPFMGVLGLAPAEPGQHSTVPPRNCGGNIDCKELIPGSTLYLPIEVPGALFSTGDGHAAQGDGEVSGTGIECPMEEVNLTFRLHKDMHLTTPRAHTPAGWITFGFDEDLNKACEVALGEMVELMMEHFRLASADALALASVVVDLRITQIANGVCGVHAVLPHGAVVSSG